MVSGVQSILARRACCSRQFIAWWPGSREGERGLSRDFLVLFYLGHLHSGGSSPSVSPLGRPPRTGHSWASSASGVILSSAKLPLEQLVVLGFRTTSLVVLATFSPGSDKNTLQETGRRVYSPCRSRCSIPSVGRGAGGCWPHCTHSQEAEMPRLSDPRSSIS